MQDDKPEAPVWKGVPIVEVRFGNRLRLLRRSRGYTQHQFAILTGVDRGYCSELERGIKSPTLKILDRFSTALTLTLAELMKDV